MIGLSTLNQEKQRAWAEKLLNIKLSADAVCLGQVINGELRAVAVFCEFQGNMCTFHLCGTGSHWMSKEFLWAMFDYPFEKLGLKVILAIIAGSNEKSLRLGRKLGFKELGRIPEALDDGGLVIFTMRPTDCRWLTLGAR